MPHVDRFSVSLDTELLAAFDRYIADHGYDNRSEAVRDLIRDLLVSSELDDGANDMTAVLTLVCDHRHGELPARLRTCLAEHRGLLHGTLSTPIDEHRDQMAVLLRGAGDDVRALAERIQAMRGISHGHLSSVPVNRSAG